MSFKKTIISSLLTIGIAAISMQANAGQSLTIVNHTNQDSTSIINNGLCSTAFGSDGVTSAQTTHVINDKLIALACFANSSNCKADIYMTNNCSGPIVATAIFDTKTGMKSISVFGDTYAFIMGAFDLTINGGI